MTAYPCCECCLTDTMHPDQHEVACPTCHNPAANRLRAERDELADKLAHMREARDNARAEVERLTALIDAVRKLHAPETWWQWDDDSGYSYGDASEAADDSGCDCPYAPEPSADLAHTAECLARLTSFAICTECARIEHSDAERQGGDFSGYAEAHYPCPTIRALDATPETGGES